MQKYGTPPLLALVLRVGQVPQRQPAREHAGAGPVRVHAQLDTPERIIGDKAYDSDALDEDLDDESIELIAPYRSNRSRRTSRRTDGSSDDTDVAGRWSARSRRSRTSAACASATRSPPCSSKDSCTWDVRSSCSDRFTDRLYNPRSLLARSSSVATQG